MFGLAHLALPFSFYEFYKLGLDWRVLALLVVGYCYEVIAGISITAGAHRLWSHRAYKASYTYKCVLLSPALSQA